MSYQVIARKYRPQRFSEVVGQDHVTRTLANAILKNRIAHAYLFCGPRGTGKTTIARIFAKCLNATNGPTVDFSDDDPRCREIAEGRSLDVLEIDAASNRGIDEIRGLRETVHYAPAQSRYRIYIIDEVHMLTREAFNALLKTLEEPPEHVKFMFATTEPEKVPATILSRCQRFDLRRIPTALIVRHLAHIARQEGVEIEEAALYAIARGADGGLRDAESALDQLISFCGHRIQEVDVLSMYGLTARDQLLALTTAMLRGQRAEVLKQLDRLLEQGKDPGRLLADLVGHFRNLMIWHLTGGGTELLDISEAERAALQQQAQWSSWEGASRMVEVLVEAEARLADSASRQVALEVALLRAVEARQAVRLDAVLEELRRVREEAGPRARDVEPTSVPAPPTAVDPGVGAPGVAQAPGATARTGGQRPETAPAAAGQVSPAGPEALWEQLLELVGRARPVLRSFLEHARAVGWEQGRFVIAFPPECRGHRDLADTVEFREILRTKLRELRAAATDVTFVVSESDRLASPSGSQPQSPAAEPVSPQDSTPALAATRRETETTEGGGRRRETRSTASAPPQKLDPEEFKNDPLIQRALEMFRARVVKTG